MLQLWRRVTALGRVRALGACCRGVSALAERNGSKLCCTCVRFVQAWVGRRPSAVAANCMLAPLEEEVTTFLGLWQTHWTCHHSA